MPKITKWLTLAVATSKFLSCAAATGSVSEPHAGEVLDEILRLKQMILTSAPTNQPPAMLTFWDFDGTILAGDCSEGWEKEGKWIYDGLARRAIEAGFSAIYKPEGGWQAFWQDYRGMDERIGHWLAYPYILQMLRGASVQAVENLAKEAFQKDFRRYYFESSLRIIRGLQAAGIEVHIISASAEVFVQGAAGTLGIPRAHIHGVRVQEEDGRLTERLIYPITWAEGKTGRIKQVIAERQAGFPAGTVQVLGGFGNSYSTDGPFLAWIADQTLPGGNRPVVLMINGGTTPERYEGRFRCVEQAQINGACD